MRTYLIASLLTALFLLAPLELMAESLPESHKEVHIFVGGLKGFDLFGDPSTTRLLRQTEKVGLYLHGNAAKDQLASGRLANIREVFATTGAPVAEIGLPKGDAEAVDRYVTKSIWSFLWGADFKPIYINVNVNDGNFGSGNRSSFSHDDLVHFIQLTQKCSVLGVKATRPVISPNGGHELILDWEGPFWDLPRQAALAGGGIVLDTPPSYAFSRGDSYIAFAAQQIKWATKNNLRSAVILSPFATVHTSANDTFGAGSTKLPIESSERVTVGMEVSGDCLDPKSKVVSVAPDGVVISARTTCQISHGDSLYFSPEFKQSTMRYIERLSELGAVPSEWDVENYTRGKGNAIGPDYLDGSIANVALWISQFAHVSNVKH